MNRESNEPNETRIFASVPSLCDVCYLCGFFLQQKYDYLKCGLHLASIWAIALIMPFIVYVFWHKGPFELQCFINFEWINLNVVYAFRLRPFGDILNEDKMWNSPSKFRKIGLRSGLKNVENVKNISSSEMCIRHKVCCMVRMIPLGIFDSSYYFSNTNAYFSFSMASFHANTQTRSSKLFEKKKVTSCRLSANCRRTFTLWTEMAVRCNFQNSILHETNIYLNTLN